MSDKGRLSASVDAELLPPAAVEEGRQPSMSAWVNSALRLKAEHDRRMRALDVFLTAWEQDHGEITEDDIAGAVRRARDRATVVRRSSPAPPRPPRGRRRGAA